MLKINLKHVCTHRKEEPNLPPVCSIFFFNQLAFLLNRLSGKKAKKIRFYIMKIKSILNIVMLFFRYHNDMRVFLIW